MKPIKTLYDNHSDVEFWNVTSQNPKVAIALAKMHCSMKDALTCQQILKIPF
jgi:hypothetical protein